MTTPIRDILAQTDAARKATNYRAAEQKINAQIKTFDGKQLTPADKKYVSQLHKLAARNNTRAKNWEAVAGGGGQ